METKPPLPETIDSAKDISNEDIRKVRFEIDGDNKTDWIEWNDENSKIHNIVDYYSDGRISDLLSDTRVNYKNHTYGAEITLPETYNSRTSRIRKETSDRIRLISDQYETPSFKNTSVASAVMFYVLMSAYGLAWLSFSFSPELMGFIGFSLLLAHFMSGAILDRISSGYTVLVSITVERDESPPRLRVGGSQECVVYPLIVAANYVFKKVDRID